MKALWPGLEVGTAALLLAGGNAGLKDVGGAATDGGGRAGRPAGGCVVEDLRPGGVCG